MDSTRDKASRGLLACRVPIDPSWPVFMACSRSNASGPRTSPTMMRSGRMRRQFFTKSRIEIASQAIQQSGFSGAGTAGNDDIHPATPDHLEDFATLRCDSVEFHQLLE